MGSNPTVSTLMKKKIIFYCKKKKKKNLSLSGGGINEDIISKITDAISTCKEIKNFVVLRVNLFKCM